MGDQRDSKSPAGASIPPAVEPVASPPSPAAPEDERVALRARLVEYENDLQRLQAEFENYQKRAAREKAQAHMDGKAEAMGHFISFNDELSAAVRHSPGPLGDDASSAPARHPPGFGGDDFRKGVELLGKKLAAIFASAGIREIPCIGVPSPHLHEVMVQQPGGEEGHIAQCLRKGWRMGDYVLRAAQVSIYSGAERMPGETEIENKGIVAENLKGE